MIKDRWKEDPAKIARKDSRREIAGQKTNNAIG